MKCPARAPFLALCLAAASVAAAPAAAAGATGCDPARTELECAVEEARGLRFERGVPIEVLSSEQAAPRLRALLEREMAPDEERAFVLLLSTLGLLPRGDALHDRLERGLAHGADGFYDSLRGTVVVLDRPVRGDEPADRLERNRETVVVHELAHALADQRFSLSKRFERALARGSSDEALALRGLAEGDAMLTELLVTARRRGISIDALLDAVKWEEMRPALHEAVLETPGFEDSTRWLRDQIVEPYILGYPAVVAAWRSGGLAAVNRLWERDEAWSTEQLLHPERAAEPPVAVEPPSPEPGETLASRYQLGELGLRAWLDSRLDEAVANQAAEGWGGDGAFLFLRQAQGQTASGEQVDQEAARVVVLTRWDDAAEAKEFASAAEEWLWGAGRTGVEWQISRSGAGVTITLRPPGEETILLDDDPWDDVIFGEDAAPAPGLSRYFPADPPAAGTRSNR